jgi:hypothetical protein
LTGAAALLYGTYRAVGMVAEERARSVYVNVDVSRSPAVALSDEDDFGSFKVVVRGMAQGDSRLAGVLEPYGSIASDGHALLRIDAVKALAGDRGGNAEWLAQLDGMIGYARSRGWLAQDGSAIQAHCEYAA